MPRPDLSTSDPAGLVGERIALAVQQPWAELIVRGLKTIEVRSTRARPRGTIYIYASRNPSELPEAAAAIKRHSLSLKDLPRGMVIGEANLVECRPAVPKDTAASLLGPDRLDDRMAWRFAQPMKFPRPLSPRFVPCGIWFYPFRLR